MSAVHKDARQLEPGDLVSLYEIDLSPQGASPPDTPLYLHPYVKLAGGTLPFMSHTWQPFPIHIEGLDFNTQGTVPRPKVIVSNIDSIVTALLREYGDFVACVVTRRRTYAKYLDDGAEHGTPPGYADAQQYEPDVFSIERKVQENATLVEFELTSAWDAEGVSLPRRQILATFCPFLYRGVECSYVGPPVADKEDTPIAATIDRGAHNPATTYATGDYVYKMVNDIRVYYASLANGNTSALTDKTKWVRDDCSKRVSACKLRFGATNPLPFGGFPGSSRIPGGA